MSRYVQEAHFKDLVRHVVRKTVRENWRKIPNLDLLQDKIVEEVMHECKASSCAVIPRDRDNPRKLRVAAQLFWWHPCPNGCQVRMKSANKAKTIGIAPRLGLDDGCEKCNPEGEALAIIEANTNITIPTPKPPKPMFKGEFDFGFDS